MAKYSKELIQRTIKCFAEKYNHHINEETADVYLESLAGFFRAFVDDPEPEKTEQDIH